MLPRGCHLRRLLLVHFCDNALTLKVEEGGETYNPAFMEEAFRVMAGRWYEDSGFTDWSYAAVCNFHDHDAECPLARKDKLTIPYFSDERYLD